MGSGALSRLDELDRLLVGDGWIRHGTGLLAAHGTWTRDSPSASGHATGSETSPIRPKDLEGADYRDADGANLEVAFGDPEPYTGQPAPEVGRDEALLLLQLRTTSFVE